jgi:hypothetical protein
MTHQQLTTNTPPVAVTRTNVRHALGALGLAFDGVESVRIFLRSDQILVAYIDAAKVRHFESVAVLTGLESAR